jgi:hypothetical protein
VLVCFDARRWSYGRGIEMGSRLSDALLDD